MTAPRIILARQVLKSQEQCVAADMFVGVLLMRQHLLGVNLSCFANRWDRDYQATVSHSARARVALYNMINGKPLGDRRALPSMLPIPKMRADFAYYSREIGKLEDLLIEKIDSEKVVSLIRQMFDDRPNAIFLLQKPKSITRVHEPAGRRPGRPPGAKNRPKPDDLDVDWETPKNSSKGG